MSVYAIYFSPTKSTEKTVKILAGELGNYTEIDLSKKEEQFNQTFSNQDVCIFGVPSYGGRVPSVALQRMKDLKGNGTPAILLVSYGNRAYEYTLKELEACVTDKGFHCIAAITAVAEHSIMHQFAAGRPDDADKHQLIQFSEQILNKMKNTSPHDKLTLPGNYPYREYNGIPLKPKAGNNCSNCRLCAKVCPVGAIPSENPKITNKKLCISCMRCVQVCPSNARKLNGILLKIASKKMEKTCSDRKENELFI